MDVLSIVYGVSLAALALGWTVLFVLIIAYNDVQASERKRTLGEYPTLSIVIPTYNEQLVIESKLKNVSMIDYPKEKLEVIVVDSASKDMTPQLVENYIQEHKGDLSMRLLMQAERLGKASALNLAFANCKGEIVIVTDADVLFSSDAPRMLVNTLADSCVGAVSAMEEVANTDRKLTNLLEKYYKIFYNDLRKAQSNIDSTPMCESELSAYKKELVGRIPESRMCDDMELALGVRTRGYRAVYNPEVFFLEYEASAFAPKLQQKTRRAIANMQALLAHRGKLFRQRYGKLGTVALPMEYYVDLVSPVVFMIWAVALMSLVLRGNATILFWTLPLLSLPLILITAYSLKKREGRHLLLFVLALAAMQSVLAVALLTFVVRGSTPAWDIIQDARRLRHGTRRY